MHGLKVFLLVTLMSASVAAMAEGGGDTVMAKMEAARESAMTTYQQSDTDTAIADNQNTSLDEAARSN
ncbi:MULTISPECIES: co-regulatory protein PtrA N-terminal domain-containing protein [unclassified Pseudomonas]|uniref:co-regulatory protein PtrA N-terminal domain-containing protein n=1 Tax=unclassified Pseudomonas TaxID=196821 RepID=UPI002AC8B420|nr:MULTISPECIES: co-regulatory protein PtrA N-terminal domain-containing protein [unclassified Pseudomonas]MEB0045617.1 co-regulatory protein PtrA N-terminal domain-containing protein [Pseudomonas sp. Dout3]MEB0095500.1 co-regulatory protein PtrA N-terminal domain-containing protein [Pseudomonas sp. DC1.2]WPX61082.1 co-regulatory protein PtrA N-terminal domain-containing protein [Pseudomonas sp. DC1.2]